MNIIVPEKKDKHRNYLAMKTQEFLDGGGKIDRQNLITKAEPPSGHLKVCGNPLSKAHVLEIKERLRGPHSRNLKKELCKEYGISSYVIAKINSRRFDNV
jgi:hypothetical protein